MIRLLPILRTLGENEQFINVPDCKETLDVVIDYYKVVGFVPPWICYFVSKDDVLVGNAGIKGRPVNGKIEIAYGTFPEHQNKGIGTMICKALVLLSQKTDPSVIVTARTLPEKNFSARILVKNNFKLLGTVWDEDDGNVWEWKYSPQ